MKKKIEEPVLINPRSEWHKAIVRKKMKEWGFQFNKEDEAREAFEKLIK